MFVINIYSRVSVSVWFTCGLIWSQGTDLLPFLSPPDPPLLQTKCVCNQFSGFSSKGKAFGLGHINWDSLFTQQCHFCFHCTEANCWTDERQKNRGLWNCSSVFLQLTFCFIYGLEVWYRLPQMMSLESAPAGPEYYNCENWECECVEWERSELISPVSAKASFSRVIGCY